MAEDDALGEGGECRDLVFPFAFEGGGGDDEDAFCFSEMMEEGAGGDGLDGFAETHFIGKQGALAECEVEHSLALVGVERVEGDVLGVPAGDDSGFVFATEGDAFGGALAGFEERRDVLGDADFRAAAELFEYFRGITEKLPVDSKSGRSETGSLSKLRSMRRFSTEGTRSMRGEPDFSAARTSPLRRRFSQMSVASVCLQVPRPLRRKSGQVQEKERFVRSRISTW